MPLVLADRVNETTTTAGTGTLTLAGAVSGFQSFAAIGNGNTTYYTIVGQTSTEWEVGIGTYTAAGTTLSRDTVLASSAGGTTKVSLSAGTKNVFCDYPAGKAVTLDGTLPITAGGTGQTTYTDGQLLIGNTGTGGLSKATLTAGSNVTITNGAGTITIAASGGGGSSTITISNKTAAYTVVAGDLGTAINCTSGTFTVSLTAAATLGSGFNCWIWNTGTGVITIDPNAAETIDGVATLDLQQGEGTQIVCNGTNWETGAKKTMRGYAENYTAATGRPVASAARAVAIGFSQASGVDSFAAANGANSTWGAQATGAICLGNQSRSLGTNSIQIGGGDSRGIASIVLGANNGNNSPGAFANTSVAIGDGASANANAVGAFAYCVGKATIIGQYAWGGGADGGLVQNSKFLLRRATTDATASVMTTEQIVATPTPGTLNQIVLNNNTAFTFFGLVVARQQAAGGTASASWKVEGLIRREGTALSTTLVASTVTVISNVPGWTLALSADTTNGCLAVTVTGAAATNIRWVAKIDTAQITYA